MRAALWVVLSIALCLVLGACRLDDSAPDLLGIADLSPHDVDVGDRLELIGNGFPEGKPATVVFRGDLHRPGDKPVRGVRIVAKAAGMSANRVALQLTDELQTAFCGRGDAADHTTFRGDISVAFAPKTSGTAPVAGTLHNAVLDVEGPTRSREVAAERQAEAERARTFLGLELASDASGELSVKSVVPKGRAERAGIEPGDVLIDLDGTSILAPTDLVPSGDQRFAEITLRRGRLRDPVVRRVDVQGFRQRAPSDLAVSAILIGLAVGLLLLFMSPTAGLITWAERRVTLRLKASRSSGRRGGALRRALGAIVSDDLLPAGIDKPLLRLLPYVLFVAASAAFTLLAFGRSVIAPDLDIGILLLTTITALVASGLMLGGFRRGGRWSLVDGIVGALSILSYQVPALIGVVCVVLTAGSLRVQDIVVSQGGAPWAWYAFANPVLLLAFVLVMAATLPEASRAPLELPEADGETPGVVSTHPALRCVMFLAEWGAVFVSSGVAAALFLGGWRVPSVSWNMQLSSTALMALGALVFQIKCWALVVSALALRWALPRVRIEQMAALCWRYLVPLSLVALLLTVLWLVGAHSPVLRAIQGGAGYVMFALSLLVLLWFSRRVAAGYRDTQAQMNVNPWL